MRINGQLMLLMLAEAVNELGGYIFNTNTDGLYVKVKKSQYDDLQEIVRW